MNTLGAVAGTFAAGIVLTPSQSRTLEDQRHRRRDELHPRRAHSHFRKQLLGDEWPSSWRELLPSPALTAEEQKALPAEIAAEEGVDEVSTPALRLAVLAAAGGSGFAALAYEVILSRALDMVIGSSVYSFTIILMAFLVGIGGGSAVTSAILR